jgi:hypothetical protein
MRSIFVHNNTNWNRSGSKDVAQALLIPNQCYRSVNADGNLPVQRQAFHDAQKAG